MLAIIGLALFFCLFNVLMVEFISNNIVVLCDIGMWLGINYIFDRIEQRSETAKKEKIETESAPAHRAAMSSMQTMSKSNMKIGKTIVEG